MDLQPYGPYDETTIAFAFMTYMIDLDAYEFHWGMKKFSITLVMHTRVSCYTHDRGSLLSKSTFVYLIMVMSVYKCNFLCIHIFTFFSFKEFMSIGRFYKKTYL